MADDEKKLPTAADFLKANGYSIDRDATRTAKEQLMGKPQGTEMAVYYNSTTRTYAYTETDNKTYTALNQASWNPMSKNLTLGSGGKVGDLQNRTPEQLNLRLNLIAKDNQIPLTPQTASVSQKAKQA